MSSPPLSEQELVILSKHLLANVAHADNPICKATLTAIPGCVIASPTKETAQFNQDYQFHWVRDGAISMLDVIELKQHDISYLLNYLNWVKLTQAQSEQNQINIYGEPKFNIDGSVWVGKWLRPQNDGAALRAIATVKIAELLLKKNKQSLVKQSIRVIKNDIEYIANHWQEPHAGIWEEVYGQHFFSLMVQRHALLLGAQFFKKMQDDGAAHYYQQQIPSIESTIVKHWQASCGYYAETPDQQFYKGGGINSSIILGALYGFDGKINGPFAMDNEKIISSAYYIRQAFEGLYPINHQLHKKNLGPMIGRYPNDVYDGNQLLYGNPWILTTAAFARYYYILASTLLSKKTVTLSFYKNLFFKQINNNLEFDENETLSYIDQTKKFIQLIKAIQQAGDHMLAAIKYFSISEHGSSLHLSEQIDRNSGEQCSAKDLTWSYSAVLQAMRARKILCQQLSAY